MGNDWRHPPVPLPGCIDHNNHAPSQVVEPKKAIVDEDVRRAEEAAAAANAIKTECEEALAEALPILVGPQCRRTACRNLQCHVTNTQLHQAGLISCCHLSHKVGTTLVGFRKLPLLAA
jgi:hypothetical protein